MNWVASNHIKPAVANLSLGGGANQALDDAITGAVAVAASRSPCPQATATPTPAPTRPRASAALTVGATDSSDARSSFSNYGSCVDLFAPGSSITSAYNTGDTATAVLSGTSMAAPHAAGVAALYLQDHPTATPAQVMDRLTTSATPGIVGNAGASSPNLLLHNGLDNIPPRRQRPLPGRRVRRRLVRGCQPHRGRQLGEARHRGRQRRRPAQR